MKSGYYIIFLAFIGITVCCKNDDDISTEEIPALEFSDITMDIINFYRATISWEQAISEHPSSILYDVYLDNALIEENIEELMYELEGLEETTSYTVKVVAKNDVSERISEVLFTTPEKRDIRLSEIKTEGESSVVIKPYEYNTQGLVINRQGIIYFNGGSNHEVYEHSYSYENEKVVEEVANYSGFYAGIGLSSRANYTYNNNQLTGFVLQRYYDFYLTKRIHTILSPTSYSYIREQYAKYGELYDTVNYTVELEFNANNQLVGYNQVNIDDNEAYHMSFEYTNENLTKVISGTNVLEIQYDTANSFLTHTNNGFVAADSTFEMETSGFYSVNTGKFPFNVIHRIPYFLTQKNTNNPTAFVLNGVTIRTFEYEYNDYDYPSTVSYIDEFDRPIFSVLTYEEIN